MIPRVLFASVVVVLGLNLHSQQPAPVQEQPTAQPFFPRIGEEKPPTDLNDEDAMTNWLTTGDHMAERMASLGVESKFAKEWTSAAEERSAIYPRFKSFRVGADRQSTVLFLPCIPFIQTAYLYLLAPENNQWKVTDHLELDCHYDDNVSFEIASIRDLKLDEILIHHACSGRGTGYLEQSFYIYAVNGRKFKEEMQTDEILREHPAGGSIDLDQASIFTSIPVTGSHSRVIEETRSQTRNGKLAVQRRLLRWNPTHARYEPSPFTPVQASAN